MKYADLHVHTHFSDSTFSPGQVVATAAKRGLGAIAICDHECVDGIEPCMNEAVSQDAELEIVPGIELTAEMEGSEIHFLGFFIDWRSAAFQKRLVAMQEARLRRLHRMVEKLREQGIGIDAESVIAISGGGSVGRLHLARALVAEKKVRTTDEAFRKYIGAGKPCYVKHAHLPPKDSIELILEMGGVPVVAHPYLMGRDELIKDFVGHGLKGVEVYHTDHDARATRRYAEIAAEYGLIATGGSDCHGDGKGAVLMGTVRVPYDVVDALKAASTFGRRHER